MKNRIKHIGIGVFLFISMSRCFQESKKLTNENIILLTTIKHYSGINLNNKGKHHVVFQTVIYGIKNIDVGKPTQYKKVIEEHLEKRVDTVFPYGTRVIYLNYSNSVKGMMEMRPNERTVFSYIEELIDESDIICIAKKNGANETFKLAWFTRPLKNLNSIEDISSYF